MFGQNTRELGWFVKAGMTPAQALATATTIPAALLGHANDLGAIAPGYFADLVAVDGDPLADINVVINKVRWVMKGGAVVVDRTGQARQAADRSGRRSHGAERDPGARRALPAPPRRSRRRQGRRGSRAEGDHRRSSRERATASSDGPTADQTGDEWIAAMKRNPNPTTFREPLTNVTVTIDSDHLAYVRADFQVMRDGKAAVARRRSVHAGPRAVRLEDSPSSRTRRCPVSDPPPRHRHRRHAARQPRAAARRASRRARRGVGARHRGRARHRPQLSLHARRSPICLPIPLTLIVNNGAVVKRKTGETELRHVLARDAARRVLDETRAPRGQRRASSSIAPTSGRSCSSAWTGRTPTGAATTRRTRRSSPRRRRRCATMLTEDPIQVMFNGSVEPMRDAGRVAARAADRRSVLGRDHRVRGARLLARRRQRRRLLEGDDAGALGGARGAWTPADVMAVGDNLNDVEMLDFAGTAVVMGNATDALKARGYRLTGSNDEGGLASAIERFALRSS